jgi:hypothetical protein
VWAQVFGNKIFHHVEYSAKMTRMNKGYYNVAVRAQQRNMLMAMVIFLSADAVLLVSL